MNKSETRVRQKSTSIKRDLALLFLIGLAVQILAGWPIRQPGTMDSHYYYLGGESLLRNRAFVEPIIWNYLEDPPGLPAPSHLYWMPLPSILVALSQAVLGPTFQAGQAPFILLAACLPVIAYLTSWNLTGKRQHALTAGFLGIFSGFFIPYWSLPETFAPYAMVGGLALLFMGLGANHGGWWFVPAGLMAGLGHLCRADGILLLAVGIFLSFFQPSKRQKLSLILFSILQLLFGYLVVMAPWFIRNLHVINAPLPTAGMQTIFLQSYDELYSYGTVLDWEHYWNWGLGNILQSKLQAGWTNLQSFIAVNNLIFLTPLSLIGFWKSRREPYIWPAIVYGIGLYTAMTFVFTFPGARGGVFHSCAALLPAVFAVSMVGLDACIEWAARKRRWNRASATQFFSVGLVLLAAGLSLFIYRQRVIGDGSWNNPAWNQADAGMEEVGDLLEQFDGDKPTVMVNNPPAFYFHTGLPAIVTPNENVARTLQAAGKYGATYLVLDHNRPTPLNDLYTGLETHPALTLLWEKDSIRVYRIDVKEANEIGE